MRLISNSNCSENSTHSSVMQNAPRMLLCYFLENNCFEKSSPGLARLSSVLLVRCVEGELCARPSNTACPFSLCTTSGWCPPTTAASCLEGPAGPAWRREGGPSVPSLATWLPRGEGGVEGGGAEEAGQREKETFPLLFLFLVVSLGLLFLHPLLSSFFFLFILSHFVPPLSSFKFSSRWCYCSDFHYLCGPRGPNSCQV